MSRDYSLGKIYNITNTVDDDIYVGSSALKNLCSRMGPHRDCAKKGVVHPLYDKMREIGVEKFKIELIKNFCCMTRRELETEEYRIIDECVKQGKKLLNVKLKAGGPMSEETKKAISKAKLGRATKSGCLRFNGTSWVFIWRDQGKNCSRSFSVSKWGEEAKKKALAVRRSVYPNWKEEDEKKEEKDEEDVKKGVKN